jgi:hypothetical protein
MFGRLIFDSQIKEFLSNHYFNKLSLILLHGGEKTIIEEGNFFAVDDMDSNYINYLPKSKYKKLDDNMDPWVKGIGRSRIRIGRFLNKFLVNKNPQDIEEFVNLWKSYFGQTTADIKIVEGVDILKWYLEDNYMVPVTGRIGTLWNSCMRQPERNKFLKLYRENPEIKMAILLDSDGKLRSRALLWYGVKNKEDVQFNIMDRIYSIFDHDVPLFKKWAKENGFIPKWQQNAKSEKYFDVDGTCQEIELIIKLEKSQLRWYPYLDTFKYFSEWKGTFSNSRKWTWDFCLIQSNGMLEPEPQEED